MLNERGLKVLAYAIKSGDHEVVNNIIEVNNISIAEYLLAAQTVLTETEIKSIDNLKKRLDDETRR